MRKLLLLAHALPIQLLAQTTFAPIGAKWTYEQHHVGGPDTNLFVIQCMGDTVIDGVDCSILSPTEGVVLCMPFFTYVATMGDSVVFRSGNAFQTLYVFDAPVGSTWTTRADWADGWTNTDTLTWTVQDTGSVFVNGVSIRTIEAEILSTQHEWTQTTSTGVLWERFGCLQYMFPWISGACDGETNFPLRCYEDSDITWLNPQFTQCDLSTGINEVAIGEAMTIAPTLLDRGGAIHIALNDRSIHGAMIEVRDVTGRLLDERPMLNPVMDLAINEAGIFTIALRENGSVCAVQRIVAQ